MRRSAANFTVSNAVSAGNLIAVLKHDAHQSLANLGPLAVDQEVSGHVRLVDKPSVMTVRRLVLPLPLGSIRAETVPGRKDVCSRG